MSRQNPESRIALARSYQERAKALESGRGFWRNGVICNDPVLCKQKKEDLLAIARSLMIRSQEVSYE